MEEIVSTIIHQLQGTVTYDDTVKIIRQLSIRQCLETGDSDLAMSILLLYAHYSDAFIKASISDIGYIIYDSMTLVLDERISDKIFQDTVIEKLLPFFKFIYDMDITKFVHELYLDVVTAFKDVYYYWIARKTTSESLELKILLFNRVHAWIPKIPNLIVTMTDNICFALQNFLMKLIFQLLENFGAFLMETSDSEICPILCNYITFGIQPHMTLKIINCQLRYGTTVQSRQILNDTLVKILKAGYMEGIWPAFRDEEFEKILEDCLLQLDFVDRPPESSILAVTNSIIQYLDWNMINSPSPNFKKRLFLCIEMFLEINSEKMFLLLPYLKWKLIQKNVVNCFQNFLRKFKPQQNNPPAKRRKIDSSGTFTQTRDLHNFFGIADFRDSKQFFLHFHKIILSDETDIASIDTLVRIFSKYQDLPVFESLMIQLEKRSRRKHSASVLLPIIELIYDLRESILPNQTYSAFVRYIEDSLEFDDVPLKVTVIKALSSLPKNVDNEKRKKLITEFLSKDQPTIIRKTVLKNLNSNLLLEDEIFLDQILEATKSILKEQSNVKLLIELGNFPRRTLSKLSAGQFVEIGKWLHFLYLLNSEYSFEIRLAMIKSVPSLISHCREQDVPIYRQELNEIFEVGKAPNPNFRQEFKRTLLLIVRSNMNIVKRILNVSSTGELIDIYIDKLKKSNLSDKPLYLDLLGAIAENIEVKSEEMAKIVYEFIDYFGHSDIALSGGVYNRILHISQKHDVSPKKLILLQEDHCFQSWFYEKIMYAPEMVAATAQAVFDRSRIDFIDFVFPKVFPGLFFSNKGDVLDHLRKILAKEEVSILGLTEKHSGQILANVALQSDDYAHFERIFQSITDEFYEKKKDSSVDSPFSDLANVMTAIFHLLLFYGKTGKSIDFSVDILSQYFTKLHPKHPSSRVLFENNFYGLADQLAKKILDNPDEREKNRIEGLRAFGKLLELSEHDLNGFAPVIGNILHESLRYQDLASVTLDIYYFFVRKLKTEILGAQLKETIIHLLPMLDPHSEKVMKIFNFLINEDSNWNEKTLIGLPSLENREELKSINSRVLKVIGDMDLDQKINTSTDMLTYDSALVKKEGLLYLRELIQNQQSVLHNIIIEGRQKVNQSKTITSIRELYTQLIRTISVSGPRNEENNRLICECLGLLGAIDPSTLSEVTTEQKIDKGLDDIELAIQLIKHFRNNLKGDLGIFSSYAIQELLKICLKCSGDEKDITRASWWVHFSDQEKAQIKPFATTHWACKDNSNEKIMSPVYQENIPANRWVRHFAKAIIQEIREREEPRSKIFTCCYCMMRDESTARLIMPHLVYYAIVCQNESAMNCVLNEFNHVLSQRSENSFEHVQKLFSLHDYLRAKEYICSKSPSPGKHLDSLQSALDRIPYDILSQAALRNGSYTRALLYAEEHLRWTIFENASVGKTNHTRKIELTKEMLCYVQRVYKNLDETDAFFGFNTLRSDGEDQVTMLEATGNWTQAIASYEQALQMNPNDNESYLKLLNCLKNLGQLHSMMLNIRGKLATSEKPNEMMIQYGIQCAWRLSEWDSVEEYVNEYHLLDGNFNFECHFANCLLHYRENDVEKFQNMVNETRNFLISPLKVASLESYQQVYDIIVQLQMLSELELSMKLSGAEFREKMAKSLSITKQDIQTKEKFLSLRKVIYTHLGMHKELGRTYLKWANLTRKAKLYHTAATAIHQSKMYEPSKYFIEYAKLLWETNRKLQAVQMVKREISSDKQTQQNVPRIQAKMRLMAVQWEENERKEEHIIHQYENIIRFNKEDEESHFRFAMYMDKIMQHEIALSTSRISERHQQIKTSKKSSSHSHQEFLDKKNTEIRPYAKWAEKVIETYCRSMTCGSKHLYHSMSRVLTLYFGICSSLNHIITEKHFKKPKLDEECEDVIATLNGTISTYCESIESFKWYTVLLKMRSQIYHPVEGVVENIRKILTKILVHFPHQSIWTLQMVRNVEELCNKGKSRSKKKGKANLPNPTFMTQLLKQVSLSEQSVEDVVGSSLTICSTLVKATRELATKPKYDDKTIIFKNSMKALGSKKYDMIIPQLKYLTLSIGLKSSTDENAFLDAPMIYKFNQENFRIMSSQASPIKFDISGQLNGNRCEYPFLCKPKDDLRQDQSVMELLAILNTTFRKEKDCRQRKLMIRTFAAIPLTYDAGLVEWVTGTELYRDMIYEQYKRTYNIDAKSVYSNYVKTLFKFDKKRNRYSIEMETWRKKVLKGLPPCLSRWFVGKFTDPNQWFEARLNFTRSSAVMSMVGYIIALGDRHTENILVQSNGELMHIDFDCILSKGERLVQKERVPFRLTQNMTEAMGITQHEGVFRKTCELVMNVLRQEKEQICTVWKSLIEEKDIGLVHLQRMDRCLDGFLCQIQWDKQRAGGLEDYNSIPLSVEGQVDILIQQATDNKNISAMWPFWGGPF